MDIRDAFPSKYLKAEQLKGREIELIITKVTTEEVGRDKQLLPVVYFHDKEAGFVLNKTNGNAIGEIHGFQIEGWIGKKITIFPTQTDFEGKQVACIRVKIPSVAAATVTQLAAEPVSEPAEPESFTDADIPF